MSKDKILNVLLVEDEAPMRELIVSWIAEHPSLRLKGLSSDGEEALIKLKSGGFDLCFLDIGLPVLSGIELLEALENRPYIIFITASTGHAIQAFEMGAVDYLHKPFDRARFEKAVDRAIKTINGERETPKPVAQGLLIREEENQIVVPFHEIVYITSHDGRCAVHTEDRDFETTRNILEIEHRLPPETFLRIHKQTIINLKYVVQVQYLIGGRYQVFLKDQDETNLTVGRKYVPEFKKRFPG